MGLGRLVIVGCFAAGLYFANGQTKVFVAAIAGVAAALSAFLNRTYLHMYGQTLSQLNRYFEQPVLTGYYLMAERLAKTWARTPRARCAAASSTGFWKPAPRRTTAPPAKNQQHRRDRIPRACRPLRRARTGTDGLSTPRRPTHASRRQEWY
ncbi:hypothetical protein [Streptomyces rubrogriseus]|uniref:hypothetical protein n=1 Tax=Streptomyces rubrogriseus TaxID=194673 RepID=UPI003651296D